MALPLPVQKQKDEAEKLQKELIESKKGDTEESAPDPGTGPALVETPPINLQPTTEPTPGPAIVPAAVTDVSRETLPSSQPVKSDNWEQKFHTLQGKYNAEIPRLVEAVNDLQAQLVNAKTVIQPVTPVATAVPQPAPPAAVPAIPSGSIFTDEEKETFGEETCKLIEDKSTRIAQSLLSENLKGLGITDQVNEIKQIKTDLESDRVKTARDKYYESIDIVVPDWEAIQATPDFVTWATEVEPMTGLTRGQILVAADKNNDHSRASTIFNIYKKEKGIVSAAQPVMSAPSLQNEISPAPSAGDIPLTQEKVKTYKMAEYQQTIKDISELRRTNKITEDVYNQKYSELITAYKEGRVVQ